MSAKLIALVGFVISTSPIASAQGNGHQFFQPSKARYISRTASNPIPYFVVDYTTGSLTATKASGTTTASFSRGADLWYPNSPSNLTKVTGNDPAIGAYPWGNTSVTVSGLYLGGKRKNWVLQSDECSSLPWASVGGAALASNIAVAPDGTTTADRVVASGSGQGVRQTITGYTLVGGTDFPMSVWAKTATGTMACNFNIADGAGDSYDKEISLTTSWQQFFNTRAGLTSGGANNPIVTLTTYAAGTIYLWGFNVQDTSRTGALGIKDVLYHIPTTVAATETALDQLTYNADNFSDAKLAYGSAAIWFSPNYEGTICGGTDDFNYFWTGSWDGSTQWARKGIAYTQFNNTAQMYYGGTILAQGTLTMVRNSVFHVVITWDHRNHPSAGINAIYGNGSLLQQATAAPSGDIPLAAGIPLYVGRRYGNAASSDEGLDSVVYTIKLFDKALTAAEVSRLYNSEKATYGR